MKYQRYFPNTIGEQGIWLSNFIEKLPVHATALELPPSRVEVCIAECKFMHYVLRDWLTGVRTFGRAATAATEMLLTGEKRVPVTLPVFTPPPLPEGVETALAGALNRVFDLVQLIKISPGFTDSIGHDLGIMVTARTPSAARAVPSIKPKVVNGSSNEAVQLGFIKNGHMGVWIEYQRAERPWEYVNIVTESPYLDDRALEVAGVPEVRRYRMRYWDKGEPSSDWSDVLTVTVGP
jgi:hypothetical protein